MGLRVLPRFVVAAGACPGSGLAEAIAFETIVLANTQYFETGGLATAGFDWPCIYGPGCKRRSPARTRSILAA
jgi:hypothetical protein